MYHKKYCNSTHIWCHSKYNNFCTIYNAVIATKICYTHIHTCFRTDLSSTDVCKGLMSDALKTVQNISRNFQMAEDSQWELLDKCITQYLSIYLKSDSKTKSVMVDDISATRSVVRTLCRFVSMLIECK